MHLRLASACRARCRLAGACIALAAWTEVFTGCRHRVPSDNLHISCTLDSAKPRVGRTNVLVQVSDAWGHATHASVHLEADMSHPGMPPVIVPLTERSAGNYRGVITFTMPGDWTLLVEVKHAGGAILEREFPLTVRGSEAPGK